MFWSVRENDVRLVGDTRDDLARPPPLPKLPVAPDAAVDVAIANNPDIAAARKETQAAAYDVKVARASRLPTVSATADGGYIDYLGSLDVRGSRSEEHTSELQSLMRISYAVFCLKKNINRKENTHRFKVYENNNETNAMSLLKKHQWRYR